MRIGRLKNLSQVLSIRRQLPAKDVEETETKSAAPKGPTLRSKIE